MERKHEQAQKRERALARKPEWLKRKVPLGADAEARRTRALLETLHLNTVCHEADCPNWLECWSRGTATFMILGVECTRNCTFCNVTHGSPAAVDPGEPARVGEAVARLGLHYVVVTSVTRDDLADGGAGQFAAVVREIRAQSPGTAVEVLIPDFGGSAAAAGIVLEAAPDVISHNMETVRELYAEVRPGADYGRSLELIRRVSEYGPGVAADGSDAAAGGGSASGVAAGGGSVRSKSGFMLGLGETEAQVLTLMDDLRAAGCELLTIGQYLAPSREHHPVVEYIHPDVFDSYAEAARARGFSFVASAPFVRSSYRAEEAVGL